MTPLALMPAEYSRWRAPLSQQEALGPIRWSDGGPPIVYVPIEFLPRARDRRRGVPEALARRARHHAERDRDEAARWRLKLAEVGL